MNYFRHNCRGFFLLLVLVTSLISTGCSRGNDELPVPAQDNKKLKVDWLLYEEREQGTGQYPVRILVSKQYLRFDDNDDGSDFLLLDRRTHTLFSVSHGERSILVIKSRPADSRLPANIDLAEERSKDTDAPAIGGNLPVHVRFSANNELCYEVILVPGLLDGVTAALTEYAEILGQRQLNDLEAVPEAMQTPCFLSRYAYRPARHYREGLPVREWDAAGYQRTLVDYGEKLEVSAVVFVLPEDYERQQVN